MSNLYKRVNSKYYWWTTRFKGRRLRKSTKMTKRNLAKKVQEQWDLNLILDNLEFLGISKNPSIEITDYCEDYLNFIESRKSENTVLIAKGVYKKLQEYLESENIQYIHQISPRILNGYIDWLKCSPKTKKNHIGVISLMLDQAVYEEIIPESPAKNVIPPKIEKMIKHRLLEPSDLQVIWQNAGIWKFYYEFLYFTGLRAGDVAMLKYGNIDREKGSIISFIRKSRKIHEFPLAQYLLSKVPEIYDKNRTIYPDLYAENERKLNDNLLKPRKHLQDILKSANRPHATLHSFRVTFNNTLRDLGLSIEDRQILLAHSSSETTKIYTHPNFDLASKFVNKIPKPNTMTK